MQPSIRQFNMFNLIYANDQLQREAGALLDAQMVLKEFRVVWELYQDLCDIPLSLPTPFCQPAVPSTISWEPCATPMAWSGRSG